MRKSLNKVKKLLVKYHSVMGDNSLTDSERDKTLFKLKKEILGHSLYELRRAAKALSADSGYAGTFRLWCELVDLTGDV